ncbi:Bax inhibitor-1/YccA family protein [Puteibacter caeruleilacunae]|nr:Bax inhibitor-1/YccA family protein [Puteibacter caeruleilacunae]
MNFTKSSNPIFGKKAFDRAYADSSAEVMTIEGAMNKSAVLLLLVVVSAAYVWSKFSGAYNPAFPAEATSAVAPYMLIGGIGGFIIAMITSFSPRRAGVLAPVYALMEGMFLGGISAIIEAKFGGQGLVSRAVGLTFGVFVLMLFLYRSKTIRVTGKFRMGIMAATGGIALIYFISWIASMFGANMGFMYGSSTIGIGFSLFVVAIAALNLILDFDFIDRAAAARAPKYMEWYAAFGLMVTLVWLYLEILKLLARFASRD